MQENVVLPAFQMDCRDWLVSTPADLGLPDEVAGAPLLAVLSSAVVEEGEFRSTRGVLTLGILDGEEPPSRPLSDGGVAAELIDSDDTGLRYLLPTPGGDLALLAEFTLPAGVDPRIVERVEALMTSFRWAA